MNYVHFFLKTLNLFTGFIQTFCFKFFLWIFFFPIFQYCLLKKKIAIYLLSSIAAYLQSYHPKSGEKKKVKILTETLPTRTQQNIAWGCKKAVLFGENATLLTLWNCTSV